MMRYIGYIGAVLVTSFLVLGAWLCGRYQYSVTDYVHNQVGYESNEATESLDTHILAVTADSHRQTELTESTAVQRGDLVADPVDRQNYQTLDDLQNPYTFMEPSDSQNLGIFKDTHPFYEDSTDTQTHQQLKDPIDTLSHQMQTDSLDTQASHGSAQPLPSQGHYTPDASQDTPSRHTPDDTRDPHSPPTVVEHTDTQSRHVTRRPLDTSRDQILMGSHDSQSRHSRVDAEDSQGRHTQALAAEEYLGTESRPSLEDAPDTKSRQPVPLPLDSGRRSAMSASPRFDGSYELTDAQDYRNRRKQKKISKQDCSLTNKTAMGKFSFGNQVTPPFLPEYRNPCWRPTGSSELLCVPYVIIAGFAKSATTDLYARLTKHPLVSAGNTKGCHFLTRDVHKYDEYEDCPRQLVTAAKTSCVIRKYARICFSNFAKNVSLFENVKSEIGLIGYRYPMITVDGSASTAWDVDEWMPMFEDRKCPNVINVIPSFVKRINPNVKVIFILRDPVERTLSGYMYGRRLHNSSAGEFSRRVNASIETFKACERQRSTRDCVYLTQRGDPLGLPPVAALSVSVYHVYLSDWTAVFPRAQIHVVRTEDFQKDMRTQMARIFKFLNIPLPDDATMAAVSGQEQQNVNPDKLKVTMSPDTRRLLQEFFQPHNDRLSDLMEDPGMTWRYEPVPENDTPGKKTT